MKANATPRHQHALVFVDHHEARVLFPGAAEPDGGHVIAHRTDKTKDGHHHAMARGDLEAIAEKLRDVGEILIAGPSNAKRELHRFLQEQHPDVAGRVVDVVPVDHLTLGELESFAREKFKRIDLWR